MKMNQQDLIDAFVLFLSGGGKIKNSNEMVWWDPHNNDITIEFPTNTAGYAVVRYYYESGELFQREEYNSGESFEATTYYKNGNIRSKSQHLANGLMHGKCMLYLENGQPDCRMKYKNGEEV